MSDKKKTRGRIVVYITNEDKEQKAIMRYSDQRGDGTKAFLRLIDDDFNFIQENGKDVTRIVPTNRLTGIGYVD